VVGVGIAGLGHVASHHIEAISLNDNFDLIAVCDRDQRKLEPMLPNVSVYTAFDELLKRDDIDLVVVATPSRVHVEHGVQVLDNGKWLLIEKPAAETRNGFNTLAEARSRNSGRCTVSLHAAFGVEVQWLLDQFKEGSIPCQAIESFYGRFFDPYMINGEMLERARSLGGSWLDSGINALSVVCQFVAPERLTPVDSRMTRIPGLECSEVQGAVDFEFESNGAFGHGVIETNWALGRDSKATVLCFADPRYRIVLDHSGERVVSIRNNVESEIFACRNGLSRLTNHYVGVFEDLARQISSDSDNFDYSAKLHDIFFDANEKGTAISPHGSSLYR
jgi:predicted dehydrogenase